MSKLTVAATLAGVIYSLMRGYLVTGREHKAACDLRDRQLEQKDREIQEWRHMALQGTDLAKKAVSSQWQDVERMLPDEDLRR